MSAINVVEANNYLEVGHNKTLTNMCFWNAWSGCMNETAFYVPVKIISVISRRC